jgi:hypothetical protein
VKVYYDGEWISGIHIGGEMIHGGGKDKLRTGVRIRVK